jgi:putative transposase
MSRYRRARAAGGVYFFSVTLARRDVSLLVDHIDVFRSAYRETTRALPFSTLAICVLPDHVHAVWQLPDGDADFSTRWSGIKRGFSRSLPAAPQRSQSKLAKRDKGIWQRRFWEHQIRDEEDLRRHIDYLHYNPVKHGLVARVRDWPYSSFHREVERGTLSFDWAGGGGDDRDEFGE